MVVCSRALPAAAIDSFERSLRTQFPALQVCDWADVHSAAAGQPSESQQSDYLVDNEDDAASLGDLVDFYFS